MEMPKAPAPTPDQQAAHHRLSELRTRIAMLGLSYQYGVEETALQSLFDVFTDAREALHRHPGCASFAAMASKVLNEQVRRITAKWHRAREEGRLESRDGGDEFRADLQLLRADLRAFAEQSSELAYDRPLQPSAFHAGGSLLFASLALALLSGGCASATEGVDDVPPVLQPFTDAAQFLLPGYSSLWFSVEEHDCEPAGAGANLSVRVARCGRSFEAPSGVGYGRYAGVEVRDFGPGGLHLVPGVWPGETAGTIAGSQVRHLPAVSGRTTRPESWCACVDGRYLVESHERVLLERALGRGGRLAELLRPFDAVSELPEDAESIVCALPRPDDHAYWGRPLPVEPTVSFFRPRPWRLILLHRQPLPSEYAGLLRSFGSVSASRTGDLLETTALSTDYAGPGFDGLWPSTLFGIAVFL